MLSRLERVCKKIIERAKEGNPAAIAELGILSPISQYLARGKTLTVLADQKCEIFSFEEFNDGVFLRVCFQSTFPNSSVKLVQHFEYDEGSWRACDIKEANMYKKGDAFTKSRMFTKAIIG